MLTTKRLSKRTKINQRTTELIVKIYTNRQQSKYAIARVLVDTGTSSTLIVKEFVRKLKCTKTG